MIVVPRTLAGSEYGRRRQECDEGTRLLREQEPTIQTLRDVNTPTFENLKNHLPEVLQRRCRFIVEENQRVMDFTAAMVRNDRDQMRLNCVASFAGMRDLYEKSVSAMERMFEAMNAAPGVIAARQSGGGFGGFAVFLNIVDIETLSGLQGTQAKHRLPDLGVRFYCTHLDSRPLYVLRNAPAEEGRRGRGDKMNPGASREWTDCQLSEVGFRIGGDRLRALGRSSLGGV
jgi:hypothetical protein